LHFIEDFVDKNPDLTIMLGFPASMWESPGGIWGVASRVFGIAARKKGIDRNREVCRIDGLGRGITWRSLTRRAKIMCVGARGGIRRPETRRRGRHAEALGRVRGGHGGHKTGRLSN